MSVHFVSLRGAREDNEDNHNICLNMGSDDPDISKVNFYGVYDGHGGKFVSKYLSENLYHFFISKKEGVKYPLDLKYVNKVYDKIQNTLFTQYSDKATECGSTCLVVCHFKQNDKDYLNIMNTGDGRCVLCRNNIGIALTKDHKPDWPEERNRINSAGGVVERDDYGTYRIEEYSVSRAFGDKSCARFITHRPELYKYKITNKDRFMILACDGLWDEVRSEEAVNYVLENCYDSEMKRINKKTNIASMLARYAISKGSTDNVSVIIVFFD